MSLSCIFCLSLEDLGGLFSAQSIVYTNKNVFVLCSPASLYISNTLLMILLKIPRLYSKLVSPQIWTRNNFDVHLKRVNCYEQMNNPVNMKRRSHDDLKFHVGSRLQTATYIFERLPLYAVRPWNKPKVYIPKDEKDSTKLPADSKNLGEWWLLSNSWGKACRLFPTRKRIRFLEQRAKPILSTRRIICECFLSHLAHS